MRFFFFTITLIYSSLLFSQEDSLRVKINSTVIEPDLINPNTRIETYLDINDSLDLFIDNIQKVFGEVEEINGIFEWKGISIDSIKGKIRVVMANGLWYNKSDLPVFQICPLDKTLKLRKNEKRGLRMRFFLSDGKDALLSRKNQIIIIGLLETALNTPKEEETTE